MTSSNDGNVKITNSGGYLYITIIIGQYQAHKSTQGQFLNARNKKKYRQEHRSELDLYDAGGTYQYFKDYQKELRTPSSNVDTILGIDRSRTQDREKAQDIS
jgi:hypothetical protein